MTKDGKELYDITKNHYLCAYELSKVRTDDKRDLTIDVRKVVRLAMNCSTKAFYKDTYESVCKYIIDELSQEVL